MREKFVNKRKKTYAIYGAGSTRLCIALANYYSSYLKKRVAVSEVGSGNLADVSNGVSKNKIAVTNNKLIGFTKMKVDYYPFIDVESTMKLSGEEYDVIIRDFKDISHDYLNLFRTCDTRLFLSNIAAYNRREFCRTKNLFENDMIEVELYCYLINSQDRLWYDKTIGKTKLFSELKELSLIRNPDKLSKEDITFLEKIAAG